MRLRTKLIAYFVVIALLVPIVGTAAVNRIRTINGGVQELSDKAVPRLRAAERLGEIQRAQEVAALSFQATGRDEDRQRYLDLSEQFDAELARLKELDQTDRGKELLQNIAGERARFTNAGTQLITARQTVDRNIANLRARDDEMVQQLNKIRARFASSGSGADIGTIPVSLRNQVNDLLLGTEGMLHQVAVQFQIASSYVLSPNDDLKQQFDTASSLFASSLNIANTAGGPEDRAILVGVQSSFRQFETSARAMMSAADITKRAREVFPEASARIGDLLASYIDWQSQQVTSARNASASTLSGANQLLIAMTVLAFTMAAGLGLVFARAITRPIAHLRDIADRVSTGDLANVDITVESNDEIGDLAASFRRMVASIKFLMMRGTDEEDGEEQGGLDVRAAS
jgi:HAMP domain-containing protein/CHASE3 domain sensor protein